MDSKMRRRPPNKPGNSENKHLKETLHKMLRENLARLYKDFEEAKDRFYKVIEEYKKRNELLDETNDASNPNHKNPKLKLRFNLWGFSSPKPKLTFLLIDTLKRNVKSWYSTHKTGFE